MRLKRWIKRCLLAVGGMFILLLALVGMAYLYFLFWQKEMIPLESQEGQTILRGQDAVDYVPLRQNLVAQKRMHCYAASAVTVMNSLQPGGGHTQDNLFIPETAHIITQDEVYQGRFTIKKLADLVHTRSGLRAEAYHAGSEESEHDYSTFLEHLKENQQNPDDQMIITYSPASVFLGGGLELFAGEGGHASPVAAFNEGEDMVLMLEVDGTREPFWIGTRDIYTAMNTIDPVSGKHRGWLIVAGQ